MFKSFLPSLKGIKHERVRYSVACSTSNTISEGLNEYFKIKKLDLFAFSRSACFHQRPLKQFWLKRNHLQVDRVDTSSSASSLKPHFSSMKSLLSGLKCKFCFQCLAGWRHLVFKLDSYFPTLKRTLSLRESSVYYETERNSLKKSLAYSITFEFLRSTEFL